MGIELLDKVSVFLCPNLAVPFVHSTMHQRDMGTMAKISQFMPGRHRVKSIKHQLGLFESGRFYFGKSFGFCRDADSWIDSPAPPHCCLHFKLSQFFHGAKELPIQVVGSKSVRINNDKVADTKAEALFKYLAT